MRPLGWHTSPPGAPYDYRVAFFQWPTGVTYDKVGYFTLPSIGELNPSASCYRHKSGNSNEFLSYDFSYSVTCGVAPGHSTSGDRKGYGDGEWYGVWIYMNKWRPCDWNPQPTTSELPLITGNAIRFDSINSGFHAETSDGISLDKINAHSAPCTDFPINVIRARAYPQDAFPGFRYFASDVFSAHPTLGFEAHYIPVIKDGEPYIYDTVSKAFFPNLGGEITIGPKVPNNYNPLMWKE